MAVQNNVGSFIPTTNIWDVSDVYQTEGLTPQLQELLVRMYQNLNQSSLNINIKDTGYYTNSEFVNGQSWFPNPSLNSSSSTTPSMRQVYRYVCNYGALPNATSTPIPHNLTINPGFTFTRIYGTASNAAGTSFLPLPYASGTLNKNIELLVTNSNVVITTSINYSSYTTTYVVLEYIKS
jgi:hypothetical protein